MKQFKNNFIREVQNQRKSERKKNGSLGTEIIVGLEEYRKIILSWLSPNFFDSFQFFVFVEVESMNRIKIDFKVVNGPAYINSRSITSRLKYKNYFFFKFFFKPSIIRRFCSIDRLLVARFQFGVSNFGHCNFPNPFRRAATSLHFPIQQGCGSKFS